MGEHDFEAPPTIAQLQHQIDTLKDQRNELAYYLAQTRFACDCLITAITSGVLRRIPWEEMDPHHVGDGSSLPKEKPAQQGPAQHIIVPNRAERRQFARDQAKRLQDGLK